MNTPGHFFTLPSIDTDTSNPLGDSLEFGEIFIPYWEEADFHRKKCRVSSQMFWTRDSNRETCGDSIEDPYTFIGSPIITGFNERGKNLKDKMRKIFLDFFSEKNHTEIHPFPVIARWRDDIHLTIASIAVFQPHVTNGSVIPEKNPIGISQPCIRLTDLAAVGRSGRHLSTFEMMAHHAFNRPKEGDMIYWIDECVRYCDEFLCEKLKINPKEITYLESPWSGGGNAGPALEVIVGGLELATLVFMNLEEHPKGNIDIKGTKYREMDLQIIDTGYGLERFCWAAAGSPTIYEAIYPESVSLLKELSHFDKNISELGISTNTKILMSELSKLAGILNIDVGTDAELLYKTLVTRLSQNDIEISVDDLKKITEPLSYIYAIPDHLHALCHMLGDGLVPSNGKSGYLSRMIARRVCRMKDELKISHSLSDLAIHHISNNMESTKLLQSENKISKILELEESRYYEMLRKGHSAVKTSLRDIPKNAYEIADEKLFRLSEERGLNPDMVVSIANDLGWTNLRVRVGFSADMAARNAERTKLSSSNKSSQKIFNTEGVPETSRDYYQDSSRKNFDAEVLRCIELDEKIRTTLQSSNEVNGSPTHAIILNRTLFYPEGGGQLGDQGKLGSSNVLDTIIQDGVIIHLTDSSLELGNVFGEVRWTRRKQIMDHHTAIHIIGGSARKILGPHIWQAGSNKGERNARIDLTHYSRITRDDLDRIEDHANEIVSNNLKIEKFVMNRSDADSRFGLNIYQGGPPKNSEIRVIKIGDHDIQACGGTHLETTSEIGEIRIIRSSQVQDGVERLQVVAGESAREHARKQDKIISESSEILGVNPDDLSTAVRRFFDEWKSQQKTIRSLEEEITRLRTSGSDSSIVVKDGIRFSIMEVEGDFNQMKNMLGQLTRDPSIPTVAVLGSRIGGGKIIVAITEDSMAAEKYDALEIINHISPQISGSGGGNSTISQGGGKFGDGIPEALEAAREILGL